eukprot:scaffold382991_cov45-Prasinocladus_malaysianus.AAC.1
MALAKRPRWQLEGGMIDEAESDPKLPKPSNGAKRRVVEKLKEKIEFFRGSGDHPAAMFRCAKEPLPQAKHGQPSGGLWCAHKSEMARIKQEVRRKIALKHRGVPIDQHPEPVVVDIDSIPVRCSSPNGRDGAILLNGDRIVALTSNERLLINSKEREKLLTLRKHKLNMKRNGSRKGDGTSEQTKRDWRRRMFLGFGGACGYREFAGRIGKYVTDCHCSGCEQPCRWSKTMEKLAAMVED